MFEVGDVVRWWSCLNLFIECYDVGGLSVFVVVVYYFYVWFIDIVLRLEIVDGLYCILDFVLGSVFV